MRKIIFQNELSQENKMATRRQLANAIRVLAMDSVQKRNLVTLVHQWGWRILLKYYGATF